MARKIQPWPKEARPLYIKFFDLGERLMGETKLAQDVASAKRLISYQKKELPVIRKLLQEMRQTITDIIVLKEDDLRGRPAKWLATSIKAERLLADALNLATIINNACIEQLDVRVIKKTNELHETVKEVRRVLLSAPLEQSRIVLDKNGVYFTIEDLSKDTSNPGYGPRPKSGYRLDLTSTQAWQKKFRRV